MMRSDADMLRVMIQCPMTARAIPTGLTSDTTTWKARPLGLNRVSCPECKQVHAWDKSDAYLEAPGGS